MAAALAVAVFALVGIGGPLLGHGVFAGTDELMGWAPYRGLGLDRAPVQNTYVDDTWDSGIPNIVLFTELLRSGQFAAWNPYSVGGAPLGTVPTIAALSPATLPYYLLPAYLAPGYVKLLEIVLAVLGTALFLRRLGTGRAAALLAGLAFASSAFLIAWTNWPQTRVAACIGFLFWGLERLVQRRRAGDIALVALAVAAMLFGGFPAVTGYALLTAAGYLVVRALAEYPGRWRRAAGVLARGAAGVLAGGALSAVQLVPFAGFLAHAYVAGRAQTPADHLPVAGLVTTLAPWAAGSVREDRPPAWYLPPNMIESLSYVGAAVLVLAVVAVAAPRRARAVLPRGAWPFLTSATVVFAVVIYGGGPLLAALQSLPALFADNFVGRARSVLGFLVAVLAGVGFEVLLRRRPEPATTPATGREPGQRVRRGGAGLRGPAFGVAVWAGAAALAGWVWDAARDAAGDADRRAGDGADRLGHLHSEVTGGLWFLGAALACAGLLRWAAREPATPARAWSGRGRRAVRLVAAAALPALVTAQALTLVLGFWPRADRDTFYPVTPTHAFLRDHLGHERYAGTWHGMGMGADTQLRLRAVTGHGLVDQRYAELVRQVPGAAGLFPTHVNFAVSPYSAAAPVLDRLGTRFLVTAPEDPVLGEQRVAGTDGIALLRPGEPVMARVPGTGPLRAVGITPAAPVPESAVLHVAVHTAGGAQVAANRRLGPAAGAAPFLVPVAAEDVPADAPLTVTVTLDAPPRTPGSAPGDTGSSAPGEGTGAGGGTEPAAAPNPLPVGTRAGSVAISSVGAGDDGLRVAHARSAVVYERLTALPRIRWAAHTVTEPDAARRLRLLADGGLRPDQVVLDAPAPPTGGAGARVHVLADGTDEITVEVSADGPGYLVVADPLQVGWAARVDGGPAELLPADHAGVAVAVPEGVHRVELSYAGPDGGVGAGISAAAATVLAGTVAAGWVHRRGRSEQAAGRASG